MSSIINRTKASSHPTPPGGIYVGSVKTVAQDGRVFVTIPKLGNTVGPLRVANSNSNKKLTIGTQVLCAYINMTNEEMYVIGNITPADIFTPVIGSPVSGQFLKYDGTNWVNATVEIFTPVIGSPVSGQFLKYDGTNWVNATVETGQQQSVLEVQIFS